MIFIIALIVFVLVSERNADDNILDDTNNNEVNNEPTETYEFKIFSEMITSLLNGNYEYSYNIVNNGITYIYNGIKCNNEELGYFLYMESKILQSKSYEELTKEEEINLKLNPFLVAETTTTEGKQEES